MYSPECLHRDWPGLSQDYKYILRVPAEEMRPEEMGDSALFWQVNKFISRVSVFIHFVKQWFKYNSQLGHVEEQTTKKLTRRLSQKTGKLWRQGIDQSTVHPWWTRQSTGVSYLQGEHESTSEDSLQAGAHCAWEALHLIVPGASFQQGPTGLGPQLSYGLCSDTGPFQDMRNQLRCVTWLTETQPLETSPILK